MRTLFLLAMYWGALPVILLTDPFWGVLEYAFINIVRPEQLLWGQSGMVGRIFYAVRVVSFGSWMINRQKLSPDDTPMTHQTKVMILLCVMMLISTAFAVTPPGVSWMWTLQFIKITIFCFVLSQAINTPQKLELYYVMSLLWFMFLEVWGLQQRLLGGNPYMEGIGGDQLADRNDLSSVVILYFPMAYYSLFSRKRWIRLGVGIPGTIVAIMFIMFAQSRGGFLGLGVCAIFIFFRTTGFVQKIKMLFTITLVIALLIGIMVPLAPEGFFQEYVARLQTMLGQENEDTGETEREGSSAARLAMWKASYYFMKDHPQFWLTGLGMKGFMAVYFDYIDEIALYLNDEELYYVFFGGKGGRAIHNSYINMATSGGIIVFFPWLYLLISGWWQAHTIPRKYPQIVRGVDIHNYARAIEIGLMGSYASITFINTEFTDFYYWHITMAAIIANLGNAKLKQIAGGVEDDDEEEPRS